MSIESDIWVDRSKPEPTPEERAIAAGIKAALMRTLDLSTVTPDLGEGNQETMAPVEPLKLTIADNLR